MGSYFSCLHTIYAALSCSSFNQVLWSNSGLLCVIHRAGFTHALQRENVKCLYLQSSSSWDVLAGSRAGQGHLGDHNTSTRWGKGRYWMEQEEQKDTFKAACGRNLDSAAASCGASWQLLAAPFLVGWLQPEQSRAGCLCLPSHSWMCWTGANTTNKPSWAGLWAAGDGCEVTARPEDGLGQGQKDMSQTRLQSAAAINGGLQNLGSISTTEITSWLWDAFLSKRHS